MQRMQRINHAHDPLAGRPTAQKVMVGIGCDRGTPLTTLERCLDQALARAGLDRRVVEGLASIDLKGDEPALLALARDNDWPLRLFSAAELARVEVPNPSAVVLKYVGTPAVAEAAALLAASATQEALLVEKQRLRGEDGRNATVSLARMHHE